MRILSLIIILLLATSSFGQKKKEGHALTQASISRKATFPGGEDSLYRFIQRQLKYPESALTSNVGGRVLLKFVVDEKGICTQIKVIRSLSPDCDSEAVNIVRKMPTWSPAMYKGLTVKAVYLLPIGFIFNQ